jgi:SAM-dependent methyltransferase
VPPDEISEFLTRRWKALGEAGALFTRPWEGLDAASARERVDPEDVLGDLTGKAVLCLAAGGGQQSAAFGALGARVTVLDLSEEQLERDRAAAERYGHNVRLEQGDIRDLDRFDDGSFDLVWHAYSINFVPDPRPVIGGVGRVLRAGGDYVFMLANPFASGVLAHDWDGHGYPVHRPYVDGAAIEFDDPDWVVGPGAQVAVPSPREYRHTLGRVLDELALAGLRPVRLREHTSPPGGATPGSWDHFKSVIPPWFTIWAKRSRPGSGRS